MATYRKRFGGKFRLGTRKSGTTFNLGRSRKQKPVKTPTVPKPRPMTTQAGRRPVSLGKSLFRSRRASTAGVGSLLLILVVIAIIGHFVH